jgi:exonuclease VII small subunit
LKNHSVKLKAIFKKYASYSSSAEDILVKLNANGLVKLEEVYRNFGKAKKIERKCKRIISSQKSIISKVDSMTIFQNCMSNFLVNFNQTYKAEQD